MTTCEAILFLLLVVLSITVTSIVVWWIFRRLLHRYLDWLLRRWEP